MRVRPVGYEVWKSMRKRCNNPRCQDFPNYGGRGIRVCARWDSFKLFWNDMGPTYTPGLSLDRQDTNGNYEPGNCRWASWKTQERNRRNNRMVNTPWGVITRAEAIERVGLDNGIVKSRTRRGWTLEEALFTPRGKYAFS